MYDRALAHICVRPAQKVQPIPTVTWLLGEGVGALIMYAMHGRSRIYDHRLSHPYNAGTEHVGFSPTRQTSLAPNAERREVFGESHEE